MGLTKEMFTSNTDEWSTPPPLFEKLDAEFGFTLDAAANEANHKCAEYYDREKDGLKQSWSGVTWCNPPYGREIKKWVRKGYEESLSGATVVMLLPARTDTGWFHDYILGKAEIRFIRRRIRFGGSPHDAPFPSMVVVFRGGRQESEEAVKRYEQDFL